MSPRIPTWRGSYAVYIFNATGAAEPVMHLGRGDFRPADMPGGPMTHHTRCGRVVSEYYRDRSTDLAAALQYRHARLFCRPCARCDRAR